MVRVAYDTLISALDIQQPVVVEKDQQPCKLRADNHNHFLIKGGGEGTPLLTAKTSPW